MLAELADAINDYYLSGDLNAVLTSIRFNQRLSEGEKRQCVAFMTLLHEKRVQGEKPGQNTNNSKPTQREPHDER